MFTGLIEQVGTIESIRRTEMGVELKIAAEFAHLQVGESIAVSGACLTVLDLGDTWFTVAAMAMTMSRTAIGQWKAGTRVNLERATRASARLGGHIVQGHVDGVATVASVQKHVDALIVDLELPPGLSDTLVAHGSVALDGVSLTVNALEGDNLQVALIDYTVRNTALADIAAGSRVHVETDVIGKYVQRLVAPYLKR